MKKNVSRNNLFRNEELRLSGIREKCNPILQFRRAKNCIVWSWQRITRGYADCDVWNVDLYLQSLFPEMLLELKEISHGGPEISRAEYENISGLEVEPEDTFQDMWEKLLDHMAFLWHEADIETCSKKNIYEEAYSKMLGEFISKYGFFGEKLNKVEDSKSNNATTEDVVTEAHFMEEIPGYKEISDLYRKEESELNQYRKKCKDEAFDLMKKYFSYLWD